jgi:hypothetical protein
MTIEEFKKLSPSRLVEVALADLEWVEQQPNMRVNMRDWVVNCNGVCYVCLAGAVMYCELDAKTEGSFKKMVAESKQIDSIRSALNSIRVGDLYSFLYILSLGVRYDNMRKEFSEIEYESYEDNPIVFKQYLKDVAELLKKHNL